MACLSVGRLESSLRRSCSTVTLHRVRPTVRPHGYNHPTPLLSISPVVNLSKHPLSPDEAARALRPRLQSPLPSPLLPASSLPSLSFLPNRPTPPLFTSPPSSAMSSQDGLSDPFLSHLLSLLQAVNAPPHVVPSSTSEPSSHQQHTALSKPSLPSYDGSDASPTTQAIQAEVAALASRLWNAEAAVQVLTSTIQQSQHAPGDASFSSDTPSTSLSIPTSHVLQSSVSSPAAAAAAGAGTTPNGTFEPGLSAQEELRLLRDQVKDVARVCKVRREPFVRQDGSRLRGIEQRRRS
jgi:hypothetical protein